MPNRPKHYAAPLRSRKAIIGFLTDHTDYYRSMSTCSPLAWNVKDRSSDLSFDNLCKVYRDSGGYGGDEVWLDNPEYIASAKRVYEENESRLWERAIADARDQIRDDEAYCSLWGGETLKVSYEFHGRSGGWLLMTSFEGFALSDVSKDYFYDGLLEWSFEDLRNLYRLVVQNDHDFRPQAVKENIEFAAAFALFDNLCVDIPRPDAIQLILPI